MKEVYMKNKIWIKILSIAAIGIFSLFLWNNHILNINNTIPITNITEDDNDSNDNTETHNNSAPSAALKQSESSKDSSKTKTSTNTNSSNKSNSSKTTQSESPSKSTTSNNTNSIPNCTPKKFTWSWVRADFTSEAECEAMGEKYMKSYGYICDFFPDECGTNYYMLV